MQTHGGFLGATRLVLCDLIILEVNERSIQFNHRR